MIEKNRSIYLLLFLNDGIRDEQTHSLISDSLFHDGGKTHRHRRDSIDIIHLVIGRICINGRHGDTNRSEMGLRGGKSDGTLLLSRVL
jgi:hypothetical protein